MTPDISSIINLGVGGVSVLFFYLLMKASQQNIKEITDTHANTIKEKDGQLIMEIDKRDKRLEERDKTFNAFSLKVQEGTTKQLSENTLALKENTRIMQKVTEHLNLPPVVNQIKVEKQS